MARELFGRRPERCQEETGAADPGVLELLDTLAHTPGYLRLHVFPVVRAPARVGGRPGGRCRRVYGAWLDVAGREGAFRPPTDSIATCWSSGTLRCTMIVRTLSLLAVVLVLVSAWVGAASVEAQETSPGEWATVHCSPDAVRSRYLRYSDQPDEATFQGLVALALVERECHAAAVAAAEETANPSRLLRRRPWRAFCSQDAVQRRHSNASLRLQGILWNECRDALRAASDAAFEFSRCRYSTVRHCPFTLFDDCVPPAESPNAVPWHQREWLELPSLDLAAGRVLLAHGDFAPWPIVRRCSTQGCARVEVVVRVGRLGRQPFHVHQHDGPWFATFDLDGSDRVRFLEVVPVGRGVSVYRGSCPLAVMG